MAWCAAAAASGNASGAEAPGWEGVEATLYAIRSLSRDVPHDEAHLMPRVFDLLPRLPPHTELRATSFRIMGYFGDWLARTTGRTRRMRVGVRASPPFDHGARIA